MLCGIVNVSFHFSKQPTDNEALELKNNYQQIGTWIEKTIQNSIIKEKSDVLLVKLIWLSVNYIGGISTRVERLLNVFLGLIEKRSDTNIFQISLLAVSNILFQLRDRTLISEAQEIRPLLIKFCNSLGSRISKQQKPISEETQKQI